MDYKLLKISVKCGDIYTVFYFVHTNSKSNNEWMTDIFRDNFEEWLAKLTWRYDSVFENPRGILTNQFEYY